jgi:hypothetical protein
MRLRSFRSLLLGQIALTMYLIQDDKIVWPQHGLTCPLKYQPILERKAAGWSWKEISRAWEYMTGQIYRDTCTHTRAIVKRYFRGLPEFKETAAFTRWLLANGIQPTTQQPPNTSDDRGIIYCIAVAEYADLVKIGKSTPRGIRNRFSQYMTAYPPVKSRTNYMLAIQYTNSEETQNVEKAVHEKFSSSRIGRSEWFYITPQVQSWISQCDPDALFNTHNGLAESQKKVFKPTLF